MKNIFIFAWMLLSCSIAMAQSKPLAGDLFTVSNFIKLHPDEMVGIDFSNETGSKGVASYFGKIGVLILNNEPYLCLRKNERNYFASDRSGGVVRKLSVRWSPCNEDGVKINVFGLNEKLDNPRSLQLTSPTYIQYHKGDEVGEFIFPDDCNYTHFVLSFTGPDLSFSEVAVVWEDPNVELFDLSLKTVGKGSVSVTDDVGHTYTDGSEIREGSVLNITATPEAGNHLVLFTLNGAYYGGEAIEVDGDVAIGASFVADNSGQSMSTVNVEKTGQGNVMILSDVDAYGGMLEFLNTDKVPGNKYATVIVSADDGWGIDALTIDGNPVLSDATVLRDGKLIYINYRVLDETMDVSATFVDQSGLGGIDGVGPATGHAPGSSIGYYNLQGIEVRPGDIVPGIYILRTAEGPRKLLVK